ncbi:MAG TPA: amidohydrolase family protein [Actinomycetota bacterium]|nr:amidohydrolase family protein [Actinomycetota bacterium]
MTTKAIKSALVLGDDGFAAGRVVLVDGDSIAAVVGESDAPAGIEELDWGDVALVPGTVNAHGHAFQSLLKGWADDRPFDSWRDDVLYPFSEDLSGDDLYAGALFAFTEALRAGVTTTVDFFYLHDDGNDNAEHVIRAARDAGIRLVFARALYDVDAPTRAPARYREKTGDAIERCRALAAAHEDDPMVSVQPAPHSLHAASPETVAAALELADELDAPCHLHLAEARYERDQVAERYGTTPVRLLAREGLLGPRLVTIHTVWADDEELDLLAESGAAVVHCPGANAFLGDGIARLPEMLARGIRVALGPDGGCANNRQSVFDEMRQASLLAKARLTDGGAVSAETAFALGTAGGADALGLPVGGIEPGCRADLVALDLRDPSLWPVATLRKQIVSSIQQTAIDKVMVGGRVVVDGGRPLTVDEAELRRAVDAISARWSRR